MKKTRKTLILLDYYNIKKQLIIINKYSEYNNLVISILKSGKNIAFISDTGNPLIADHGNFVVKNKFFIESPRAKF